MPPGEQDDVVKQRPELQAVVEAARRFWKRVFVALAAIATLLIGVTLAAAFGALSLRIAFLLWVGTVAAPVLAIFIFGRPTFYSARSTRN